jgi:hypothetical protein
MKNMFVILALLSIVAIAGYSIYVSLWTPTATVWEMQFFTGAVGALALFVLYTVMRKRKK